MSHSKKKNDPNIDKLGIWLHFKVRPGLFMSETGLVLVRVQKKQQNP